MRYFVLLFIVFLTSNVWAEEIPISQFTEAIEKALPNSKYQYFQFRARAYSKRNMNKEALSDLNNAIYLNPNISAYKERSKILMKMGRYQEAINDLNIILITDPDNPKMYRLRSKAYFEIKQYQAAMEDAKRVLAEIPNDSTSRRIIVESTAALTPVKNIIINTRRAYVPVKRQTARPPNRTAASTKNKSNTTKKTRKKS